MTRWFRGMAVLALLLLAGAGLSTRAAAQREHEVQPGQTLSTLARRYGVAMSDLASANGMQPDGTLRAGQTLTIPPRGVTYVRPGQTLSHIAREHDCTVEALQRQNGLRAATRLRAGSRLELPGFAPAALLARDFGQPERPGFATLLGRTAYAEIEIVDADGRVRLGGLRALAELMRRDLADPAHSAHPRLAVLLAKISDHFGGREIRVVSGFREAGGATRETSRHTQGRAADIQVSGVPARAVFEYCRSLAQTGCGLYPSGAFVHVDVREQSGQWVDWSRRGRRARYGTLQRPYRRSELKRPDRPRIGRVVTRPDEVPLTLIVVNKHNAVVRTIDERPIQAPSEQHEQLDDEEEQNAAPDQPVDPAPSASTQRRPDRDSDQI
jgi:uncharacterized protein YcbK (DUF882 family)/LysM repeat protein